MAKIKMTQLNRSMVTLNLQLRMILRLVLNLCRGDDGDKIPFISEVASKEVKDENINGNTLYTLEIKIENDHVFIAKVEEIFRNWDPLYFGNPRGILVNSEKRS